MVWIILLSMQNFKLLVFLLLEISHHKVTLSPEGNESLSFDIYSLESTKIRKKSLLIPRNIFSGPRLFSPMHFPSFQAKQKNSYIQFFETCHLKNNCNNPLVNRFPLNSAKACLTGKTLDALG